MESRDNGRLTLIANPGSASRKYALYADEILRAALHFEYENSAIVCTYESDGKQHRLPVHTDDLAAVAHHVVPLFIKEGVLHDGEHVTDIGLRVVAPSSFFLQHHVITDEIVRQLEVVEPRAPLHIAATLAELRSLREQFEHATIVGISDSAFHATKPDYAWNYGLPLHDADRLDIKRFGYHGLSAASAAHALRVLGKLPAKIVVCHLGSGSSITALHGGKSIDTTMGYSPLEGVVMATRSGTIDPTAAQVLKDALHFDDKALQDYLNHKSGLLGLSGSSSDIRELLRREGEGDHTAALALATYVYNIQKGIGQMVASLGGLDMLVFTGTVGERSAAIRERITAKLHYLDLQLDKHINDAMTDTPSEPKCISKLSHSRPVYVIPANEAAEMIRCIHDLQLG